MKILYLRTVTEKTLLSHKIKDLHWDFKLMQIQKRSYSQHVLSFGSRQVRICNREDETGNMQSD